MQVFYLLHPSSTWKPPLAILKYKRAAKQQGVTTVWDSDKKEL